MRQLLKIINYADQLMALIDIGKTIKRWATKNDDTRDGQTENKTRELARFFKGGTVIPPFYGITGL